MSRRLEGRIAMVTGGELGIGRASALRAALDGTAVADTVRRGRGRRVR
ncbi:MAG TPA: hypothetical protein VF406_11010 [Thermodesulfobacteriota bacterium]